LRPSFRELKFLENIESLRREAPTPIHNKIKRAILFISILD